MKSVVAVWAGVIVGVLLAISSAGAQVSVGGSVTDNGTYVAPDNRSSSDSTVINNDSYRDNANPYTGAMGANEYRHSPSLGSHSGPSLDTPVAPDYGISTQRRNDAYSVHPSYGLDDHQ